jgi:hypothetical protein
VVGVSWFGGCAGAFSAGLSAAVAKCAASGRDDRFGGGEGEMLRRFRFYFALYHSGSRIKWGGEAESTESALDVGVA